MGVRRYLSAAPLHWWLFAISALCWVYLILTWLMSPMSHAHSHHATHISLVDNLIAWMLMVYAMMLPMLSGAVRWIAQMMPRYQHAKVIALFVLGYSFVWLMIRVAIEGATFLLNTLPGNFPLNALSHELLAILAFLAAGLWSHTRFRRQAVFACGNGMPMRINGWDAYFGALQFGLSEGRKCAGSCLHIMLALVLASHQMWLMVLVTFLLLFERSLLPRETKLVAHTCFILAFYFFMAWQIF